MPKEEVEKAEEMSAIYGVGMVLGIVIGFTTGLGIGLVYGLAWHGVLFQ